MRNLAWQAFFQSFYPVWSIVGLLVALNYGRASNRSWRDAGGTWFGAIGEWLGIVWFVIAGCTRDAWALLRLRPLPVELPIAPRYSAGHLLRLFIMLSFLTSGTFGLILVNVDRSHWETSRLVMTAASAICAYVAGLGHLFLAWSPHPRRWRWLVFILTASVPIQIALRLS